MKEYHLYLLDEETEQEKHEIIRPPNNVELKTCGRKCKYCQAIVDAVLGGGYVVCKCKKTRAILL